MELCWGASCLLSVLAAQGTVKPLLKAPKRVGMLARLAVDDVRLVVRQNALRNQPDTPQYNHWTSICNTSNHI